MEDKKYKITKANRIAAFHMNEKQVEKLWAAFNEEVEEHKCEIWFDVYSVKNGKKEKIIGKGELVSYNFLKELKKSYKDIYIPVENRKELNNYIDRYIEKHLSINKAPANEHSKKIYDSAVNIMKDLFEKPVTKEAIAHAKDSAHDVIGNILDGHVILSSLLEVTSYDYYTYTHSVDVAVYSVALAKSLGMSDRAVYKIGEAAILHDIGKTKINIGIVNKQGRLTDEEFEAMKKHPEYGYDLLVEQGETDPYILLGAMQHHEKIDGTGYPYGLKGKQINPIAMIISCADIFDALTTKRSYKEALTSFEALEIMDKQMAAGLNKKMLERFIRMMGQKSI